MADDTSRWWEKLMARKELKKASEVGDKPKAPAQDPVPNYVEQEIKRQKPPASAPADDNKKKQPRIGFRPDRDSDSDYA